MSVCVCLCVSVSVYGNSKYIGSTNLKFEHIVVYENNSDEFNIGQCRSNVKVIADYEIFLYIPQYKLSSPIFQLWHKIARIWVH